MFNLFKTHALIDGRKVKAPRGSTILEAARRAGIEIPTLCHVEGHRPSGVCRVCVVEVQGSRTLVGSCHTPLAEGMVIRTNTPRVIAVRKAVVELMLTAHTGTCVNDPNADNCGLHNLASDHEVGAPRFNVTRPRFYPVEEENPYVRRDLSKCILCRRCITACRQIAARDVLAIGYRGFSSAIVTGYDEPLVTEGCRDCGVCIDYCPTGALSRPQGFTQIQTGARPQGGPGKDGSGHGELLPMLRQELARSGALSREAMLNVADKAGISLSDVYGTASFYAYLPLSGRAKNRIRICRCVPCDMQGARTIIGTLQKELGILPGEVTADGLFSLELAGCIGACARAPAMLVNDDLHGNLTPERITDILREYRQERAG